MTSTEIAVSHGSALAITSDQENWTPKQVAGLAHLGIDKASDGDLDVFFHQCQRTGLDPFVRQIYMIARKQWNADTGENEIKQTIQTGIDGFRLIARRAVDRTRETLGYEDNLWCGKDGVWRDVWLDRDNPPLAAKVTVLRNGQKYTAVATLAEYAGFKRNGQLTKMWADKPALMLAKCAEALALRKAFPQDLSGLYTSDEMSRVDVIDEQGNPAPQPSQQRQGGVAGLNQRANAQAPDPETEQKAAEDFIERVSVETDKATLLQMHAWAATGLAADFVDIARSKVMERATELGFVEKKAAPAAEPTQDAAATGAEEPIDAETVPAS